MKNIMRMVLTIIIMKILVMMTVTISITRILRTMPVDVVDFIVVEEVDMVVVDVPLFLLRVDMVPDVVTMPQQWRKPQRSAEVRPRQ